MITDQKIVLHWLLVAILGASGCAPSAEYRTAVSATKSTTVTQAPSIRITARPSYRLIVKPQDADAPARLMVLHVRIKPTSDGPLRFRPSDLRVSLPDGTTASVFDHARAVVLLERLNLGVGNLAYVANGRRRYPPGGLGRRSEKKFRAMVIDRLLDEAEFSNVEPLEGFLVVDMGHPLASLDGVVLEVRADRDGQSPLRDTYRFSQLSAVSYQLSVFEE